MAGTPDHFRKAPPVTTSAAAPAQPTPPVRSNKVGLIFGREPALWAGFLNTAVFMLGAYVFHLSTQQESGLIAGVAAVLGIVVAFQTDDGVSAAILGLVKGAFALALGFGAHISADHLAEYLSAAATLSALFVRTQATAHIDENGHRISS